MQKAYFSNISSQILSKLKTAKDEVLVAMAWFTSDELFKALIECINRNVRVELVLLDHATNYMYYAPDFNEFIKAGGKLRIANAENGFMHHKFCVIDNDLAITGSYNWTYSAENRNIENIIITDNDDIISQYKSEFKNLISTAPLTAEAPRLEWDEIENYEYVDIHELNYEIGYITKARNLPQKQVIKSTTKVTIEERPLNPISRYNIGIKVACGSMLTIIKAGAKLPYTSEPHTLYNYEEQRKGVKLTILHGNDSVKAAIAEKLITEITSGRTDWELTIKVQFTLVPSGDLFAEVRCMETGKVMNVKTSIPDLVDYEE
jgi:hypothetical protein